MRLDSAALLTHYLSIGMVLTTIHAQDFQDEEGDRLEKRRTIPIVMPECGRLSMPVALITWSVVMGWLGDPSTLKRASLTAFGGLVGARFYYLRTVEADKTSYILYNVSISESDVHLHHD